MIIDNYHYTQIECLKSLNAAYQYVAKVFLSKADYQCYGRLIGTELSITQLMPVFL